MKSLKFILEDINQKIGSNKVFKYKTSDLLTVLTDSADRLALNNTIDIYKTIHKDEKTELFITHMPYAYRQILKFIYMFSNEDGISADNEIIKSEFKTLIQEMFLYYNEIRNRIDRYELGKIDLRYDETTKSVTEADNIYKRRNYIRATEVFNVANNSIKHKYAYLSVFLNDKNSVKYFKYMPYFQRFLDNEKYSILYKITMMDSEVSDNIDFGDFTYFDVLNICTAINYISLFKLASNSANFLSSRDLEMFYQTPKEIFVKHISDISKVKIDIVDRIINLMIYNLDYQIDKLTLIQHLIMIEGQVIFSPYIMIIAELPKKVFRLINDYDRKKYEVAISKVAKTKEISMLDEICNNYVLTSNLLLKTNVTYSLPNSKNTDAEYDLVIFDQNVKTLYLCECKWFFIADGEFENNRINKKIYSAIKHRIQKDKLAKENITHFSEKVFGNFMDIVSVKSLMISYTHMGDDDSHYDIPVVDFSTFKELSIKFNYEIHKIYDCIVKQCFINDYDVITEKATFDYYGYRFTLNKMKVGKT